MVTRRDEENDETSVDSLKLEKKEIC